MANNETEVRRILDKVKAEGRTSLTAPEGKLVCDAYGIPVPKEGVATSAADAAKLATGMGFPVVLKIVSPEILHKTEAGGVLVGVKSADEVQKGFDTIMANAKKYNAKANLLGVQVQQMLSGGQEVIVGAVTDPSFGKLVAFGLGGVLVEVLKDITFRLAPATREDALSMQDGIAAAAILKGVRGADPIDREALARIIEEKGGTILTSKPIVRIKAEGGRATSVEAADGSIYKASKAIVSTIHVKHLEKLVGAEHLPGSSLKQMPGAYEIDRGVSRSEAADVENPGRAFVGHQHISWN